jgi:hypothetical protein
MARVRWLGKFFIGSAVLLGLVYLGARFYLSSDRAAHRVARGLQEVLGGTVHVRKADLGVVGSSRLSGIEVYQPDAASGDKPWIEVAGVAADVSAVGLLCGELPATVHLENPKITLQFDLDNHLVTRLPVAPQRPGAAVPPIHIDNGDLTLACQGRPPMVIHHIDGVIAGDQTGLHLDATITDPYWGQWTAVAHDDTGTRRVSLDLQSPPMQVTMEKLQGVPFITKSVWEQVQADGRTPVHVALTFPPPGPAGTLESVHHRVDLEPVDTRVHVTSIDLDADKARGKVVIEDQLVTLTNVVGASAGGEIHMDAKLDFRQPQSDMDFKVNVAGLALHGLPPRWQVSRRFDGKLSGSADLRIQVVGEKVKTSGGGDGHIDHLRLGPAPFPGEIKLLLRADDKGFRFTSPSKGMSALVPLFSVALIAPPPPRDPITEDLLPALLEVPRGVVEGVTRAANGAIDSISAAGERLRRLRQPPPPGQDHNYLEADFSLSDADLGELVSGLGLSLPFKVAGKLSVQVRLGIPTDAAQDMKAYRAEGTAQLPVLRIEDVEFADVRARVRYAEGMLRLTEFRGKLPPDGSKETRDPGTFTGTARLQLVPAGPLQATLRVERFPVDRLLTLLPGVSVDTTGELSGVVEASVPSDRMRDPAAWEASADLTSPWLRSAGLTMTGASLRAAVARGTATLTDLHGRVAGGSLAGSGDMGLTAPYPYQSRIELLDIDAAALALLAPAYRPPVTALGSIVLDADLRGSLQPLTVAASGKASAQRLRIEGMSADSVHFDWAEKGREISLRNIYAQLGDGTIKGTATVPLAQTQAGEANLRLHEVNIENLLEAYPSFPVRVAGKVDGTVRGTLTAARAGGSRRLTTQIELGAPQLRIQGIPAQRLGGSIDYRGGAGEYQLQGETLGGRFRLEGKLPPPRPAAVPEPAIDAPAKAPAAAPPDGRLQIEGVRLGRLWDAFGWEDVMRLRGIIAVDLPFRYEGPDRRPVGQGTFRIAELRWDGEDRADAIQGDLRLDGDRLELCNVTGALGEGLIGAHVVLPLARGRGGSFNINLTQVEASRLLKSWPDIGEPIQGPLDVSLRGTIDGVLRGGGTIVLTRGRVLGVEVSEWRLPVQFSLAPRWGDGQLRVSDTSAAIAHGRAMGRAYFTWAPAGRLEGNIRFYDVDLRALMATMGDSSTFANGRVAGRIDLGGSEMHSVEDLTATLSATLSQAQALQLPVLKQIVPYIRPGMSSSSFQTSQLEGRLSRGNFRIQRMTLEGGLLQMIVEGTINMQGRIDLDVTARTDNITFVPPALRLLGLRLPAAGVLPAGLIVEASLLLANRTVRLHVTGTVRNPVIQVQPLRLLTQEAVRYFLTRALIPTP